MSPPEFLVPYVHKILLFAEGGLNDGVRVEQAVSLLQFLMVVIEKCRLSETHRKKVVDTVNEYWLLLLELRPTQVSEYVKCFYHKMDRNDVYDVRSWLSSAFTNHCRTCEVCERYQSQVCFV